MDLSKLTGLAGLGELKTVLLSLEEKVKLVDDVKTELNEVVATLKRIEALLKTLQPLVKLLNRFGVK